MLVGIIIAIIAVGALVPVFPWEIVRDFYRGLGN